MILAIDVDYIGNKAFVAGVAFKEWASPTATQTFKVTLNNIADYEPGAFYKREMPCILELIEEHQLSPSCIVIDGFVWLDGKSKPGLGAHLYEALNKQVPIIGVAKKPFVDIADNFAIYRGESKTPLYVTSVGIDQAEAARSIKNMDGKFRLPTLLKLVDQLCRDH